MKERAPSRSDDEWLQLITECRQSGLSDAQWCLQHGIVRSSFHNAITRLHKKACKVPERADTVYGLDLVRPQPPVEVRIVPEDKQRVLSTHVRQEAEQHIDNPHMIEITIGSAALKIRNGADPDLLREAIMALGRASYAG